MSTSPKRHLGAGREPCAVCGRVAGPAPAIDERLAALEREHRNLADRSTALEQQLAELGNQCVVMERLHGALEHAEVLAAIQDCVINVIGSEELAVFVPSEDGLELRPAQCFGVEGRGLAPVPVGAGVVGRAALGDGFVVGDAPPPPEAPDLTACVPLQAGDRLSGVLAIWKMLPHKPTFGPADRGVLDLLARHAASALQLTSVIARERAGRTA